MLHAERLSFLLSSLGRARDVLSGGIPARGDSKTNKPRALSGLARLVRFLGHRGVGAADAEAGPATFTTTSAEAMTTKTAKRTKPAKQAKRLSLSKRTLKDLGSRGSGPKGGGGTKSAMGVYC